MKPYRKMWEYFVCIGKLTFARLSHAPIILYKVFCCFIVLLVYLIFSTKFETNF